MAKVKGAAVIETLADLKPDPRNARKHNARNVGMVERALGEVGAARSIVIDEHGVVLAGNATIEAAGRVGIERVQVVDADGETLIAVRRTGLTQAQKTRLALYDNRTAELADWDTEVIAELAANERDMLDGLFADAELAELVDLEPESADAEPQIDRAEELRVKWQTERGQLWRIGDHRLLCGDCTITEDVARLMGGAGVDMIATDPPYGIDYEYDGYYKDTRATHTQRLESIWKALPEHKMMVLTPGHSHLEWFFTKQPHSIMVWYDKTKQSSSRASFLNKFELILIYGEVFKRYKWDVFEVMGVRGDGLRELHSCPKPVALFDALISEQEGVESVYDPFLGSGTTMVAAQNLGRKCYGIEISPAYCAVILERMQTAFPALSIERA